MAVTENLYSPDIRHHHIVALSFVALSKDTQPPANYCWTAFLYPDLNLSGVSHLIQDKSDRHY